MGTPRLRRVRERVPQDSGFTMIEAVVALFVLGAVFTALAAAAIGSLRASKVARVEQQGVDFATEALEAARHADYEELAHTVADLAGDPRVSACGPDLCMDPGTGTPEVVVTSDDGVVSPHITQVDLGLTNNVPMTLSRYVTDPGDTTADTKRVTVIATWSIGGLERERLVSGVTTLTDRGLPLPVFKLTPLGDTSAAVNPDTLVPFGFELTNQGAPDRWNLEVAGDMAHRWELFRDDGNRIFDGPPIDMPLTNTNASEDAIIDTGRIDPTGSVVFWAVREVEWGDPVGDDWASLTATSAAQAGDPSGTASVDLLVRVVPWGTPVGTGPGGGQLEDLPGAPQDLQVGTGDGELSLTWSPPASEGSSAITDYVVYYKDSGSVSWTTFADGVSTATSAVITGLVNGTVYDVGVAAANDSGTGTHAAIGQGQPDATASYTPPTTCAASLPAPPGWANGGFTLRRYYLHNRSAANPSWPGPGIPAATSTIGQGLPLITARDLPQVPPATNLPVYSSDVVATEAGRVLVSGGSLGSSDTTRVIDWRATAANKAYKGTAVLRFWVAPVSGDDPTLPWSVTAQAYVRGADGVLDPEGPVHPLSGPADSFGPSGCGGWQEVWVLVGVNVNVLDDEEYIGVRLWNPGNPGEMPRLRVAYDVAGDFPSSLILPEKP